MRRERLVDPGAFDATWPSSPTGRLTPPDRLVTWPGHRPGCGAPGAGCHASGRNTGRCSQVPATCNPAARCRAKAAAFSGKTLLWMVQTRPPRRARKRQTG
jgi:hypothetical protein